VSSVEGASSCMRKDSAGRCREAVKVAIADGATQLEESDPLDSRRLTPSPTEILLAVHVRWAIRNAVQSCQSLKLSNWLGQLVGFWHRV
jgi:hypothetical protein